MSQSVIELVKELTLALVETGNMPPEAMQETRPWEKKQQLLQAREYNGHASPAPDGEAVHEAAEELNEAMPPKRERGTTPKKTTVRRR